MPPAIVGESGGRAIGGAAVSAPDHRVVAAALAEVAPAETAFRSRWRLGTLRRVDADLYDRVCEQIDLYNTALITGTAVEVQDQAAAMVRGWRAAVAALESPLLPDDAYLVGVDYNTGTRVVVVEQAGSVGRVQALKGERVVIVTPDEVARMVAGMAIVAEAKQFFPDAELLSVEAATQ
ncbi:hypothetical protein FPZ24_08225 [Sphingomonas panacisoli]|uniref:Uncharacterized protein n=1 Tax=Sphingomonas panacisoli TaxID=1813879 RepID=A0A5B8LI24_9SPHN|nr:hypothetical protein [Sphingomonas panacisoli]QDZ07469.1 hypothetical protein FPZ24_08225 [Sphingomonas panacisoli]